MTTRYMLFVRVHQPPRCAILIDIVERECPRGFDLDTAPVPLLLEHDPGVLRRLGHQFIRHGYALRVDLWPRPLTTHADLDARFAELVAGTRHQIYTAIYCIPDGPRKAQTLAAVDTFLDVRDQDMLDQIFNLGASRIMHEESALTLTVPCADLEEMLGWMKDVLERAVLPVSWPDEP